MKILFTNVLCGGTYSATNAQSNYPAENLDDDFLRLRYQAAATSDAITIDLASAVSMDSFYMSYIGSVSTIDVAFYAGDVVQFITLGTAVSTGDSNTIVTGDGNDMHFANGPSDYFSDYAGQQSIVRYFDLVTSIDRVVITLTGTNPFYIGGVAAGSSVTIPVANTTYQPGYDDESSSVRSSHGQVQAVYVEPTRSYTFSFDGVTQANFDTVFNACRGVGPLPVWATFFEDSTAEYPPGYYQVTMQNQQRTGLTYSFQLVFSEAR